MCRSQGVQFAEVLRKELEDIERRRRGPSARVTESSVPSPQGPVPTGQLQFAEVEREQTIQQTALKKDLVGLAFSGGGIRSATWCLGILQGLARYGLLKRFDYLSTVSGGGYIGSWLMAWIKREGNIGNVELQLQPNHLGQAQAQRKGLSIDKPVDEEPEPIYHLRAYSNYIAPRPGLFSADSWVLLAIYLRNIILNYLVLLPVCMAVLLAPRLLLIFFNRSGPQNPEWELIWVAVMLLAVVVAFASITVALHNLRDVRYGVATPKWEIQYGVRSLELLIILPFLLFAVVTSCYFGRDVVKNLTENPEDRPFWQQLVQLVRPDHLSFQQTSMIMFATVFAAIVGLTCLTVSLVLLVPGQGIPRAARWKSFCKDVLPRILWYAVSAGIGGVMLYVLFAIIIKGIYKQVYHIQLVASLGPPLTILAFFLGVTAAVGLLSSFMQEEEREWWASLGGWLFIWGGLWACVVGVSLFAPFLVTWVGLKVGGWAQAALASGWLATAMGGILAGRSPQTQNGRSNQPLEWIALIAPPIFLVGLLALISLLLDWILGLPQPDSDDYWVRMVNIKWHVIFAWVDGCLLLACLMSLFVDVNTFSLQGTYANRLVRCYLGASRRKESRLFDRWGGAPTNSSGPVRQPNPITGFDPRDDLLLPELTIGVQPQQGTNTILPRPPEEIYWGPYPIINTAMNLTEGDELAWQERKAESFILTPRYCGSRSTGYRHLDPQEKHNPLMLGTAVALSGAAVSPNMGYHSSASVTALLTLFNVRLGGWVSNPRYHPPGNRGPWQGLLYLLKELFGRTNARASYVYLSDGGHFENLGIYELVRRRCRYIVACDGGADPAYVFDDLGNMIRKCQVDFGVSIEITAKALCPQGPESRSLSHCAIGKIHYEDIHPGIEAGLLVYIKASLTGKENADILNFAVEHPPFPHQSTLDQFFSESQFESYRALGVSIALNVFEPALKSLGATKWPVDEPLPRLFQAVNNYWLAHGSPVPSVTQQNGTGLS